MTTKMKNKTLYIAGILALSIQISTLRAQEVADKSFYSFERIELKTPWLTSENGAGLVFNKVKDFSTVGGYFSNQSGDYTNYNDPQVYESFGLSTKSYMKVKKFYFYGSFGYDYGVRQNQSWLGTIYPNTALNPICDSVPGKVLREDYFLAAKIGYKVNDKYSLGVAFDYHTATGAKRKDGRNSNVFSDFSVRPGVTFNSKYLTLGLNANYSHSVERVEYKYLGDVTGKSLYYFEPFFFYTESGINSSSTYKRGYFSDIFGGALQVELKLGKLAFYNQLQVNYTRENDFEDNNLLKRYATIDGLKYKYNGVAKYSTKFVDHIVNLRFISDETFSYNVINNYERVPGENNVWAYFEYGKDLRYIQTSKNYGAEYNAYLKKSEWLIDWTFSAGFNYFEIDKQYKVYPAKYEQNYNLSEVYGSVAKSVMTSDLSKLDLSVGYGYTFGKGDMLKTQNPLTTGALKQNEKLLYADFMYNTANKYRFSFASKFTYAVEPKSGKSVYAAFKATHIQLPQAPIRDGIIFSQYSGGANRGYYEFSFGFNF